MIGRLLLMLLLLVPLAARAWEDQTGDRDMPWMGRGGRAHWFFDRSSCLMCPTGYTDSVRWGRWRFTSEDPYLTVGVAMRFLQQQHVLDAFPAAIGEGSVGGDGSDEIIRTRTAPYRFTVVMIEPTVVIMRYDLGALAGLPGPATDQIIGTPRLRQWVEYGTRIPDSGSLQWFAPGSGHVPAPVTLSTPDHGEIVVDGIRLDLRRRDDYWDVTR